ncbi:serine hydrolase domain-containing protein [Peristeroidobacter agariperforans]|uniref:serine hydrolase domain-containing protein n=1 Tax=Peristeroidobacter agariperforans TaxID=268404 RepID=UPI0013009100|nr:serine hydrolase domain-containing protein [Peristeroidobacter agariperforans]
MSSCAIVDAAALDELFVPYDRTDSPGFAVGIALNGIPRYRRGFGMANVELPVALSPGIRMRIGSTSKHFCVLAVMLLVERGRLSIHDSPRKYLPELPAWADAMTIEQLMSHTSGMRDSLDLVFHSHGPGVPVPSGFQLRMLSALDSVNFAPGTDWNYNNGGYVLLSEIVERLSGQPFGAYLKEHVFDAVGMHDTVLRELDTDLLSNSATLHIAKPGGGYMRGIFGPAIKGEGGIVSTVDDMLKWLRHMSAPLVGSAATWAAMRTALTTHGYGLGLVMSKHRGQRTVHHAGGVVGGSSQMIKFIDHELDIIVMTNGSMAVDMYRLVDAIADRCLPGLPPAPQDVPAEPVTGTFYSQRTGRVLRLVGDEGRQAVVISGMTLPALRSEGAAISVPILPSDLIIRPVFASEAPVQALNITEFGRADRLERVEPPASYDSIVGEYSSAAGLTASVFVQANGRTRMRLRCDSGRAEYQLDCIGPGLWQAASASLMPLGGTLEVSRGGFEFTTGRTIRLHFERAQ